MTEFEFAANRSSLLAVPYRFQSSIFFHSVLKNRIPAFQEEFCPVFRPEGAVGFSQVSTLGCTARS